MPKILQESEGSYEITPHWGQHLTPGLTFPLSDERAIINVSLKMFFEVPFILFSILMKESEQG